MPIQMTPEVEAAWVEWHRNQDSDAQETLIRHYASLASYLARRALAKAPPHQDAADLVSYAQHGLLDALRKFDPEAGVKFETYATRRVTGAIIDGQRKDDPLARAARKRVKTMNAAIEVLWETLDREPTDREVSEQTQSSDCPMTVQEVRETRVVQQTLTSELNVDRVDEEHRADSGAETEARMTEVREALARRLPGVRGRSRAVLLAHYCDDQPLPEVGKDLGLTGPQVRESQREIAAILTGTHVQKSS